MEPSFWQVEKSLASPNHWVHNRGKSIWATVGALRPSGLRAWSVYDGGTVGTGNIIPREWHTTTSEDPTVAEGFGSGDDAFADAQAALEAYVANQSVARAGLIEPS